LTLRTQYVDHNVDLLVLWRVRNQFVDQNVDLLVGEWGSA
jgi:hypothetical protein